MIPPEPSKEEITPRLSLLELIVELPGQRSVALLPPLNISDINNKNLQKCFAEDVNLILVTT
jgi:hypothetical protein